MLDGALEPSRLMDLALESLPLETDEQNIEEILRELRLVYWRFTPAQAREALAPRVEQVLRAGLSRARTQGPKGAYFATLRIVALTPRTVEWLTSVWQEHTRVPGLTLAETDYIALAQELALRAGTGAGSGEPSRLRAGRRSSPRRSTARKIRIARRN